MDVLVATTEDQDHAGVAEGAGLLVVHADVEVRTAEVDGIDGADSNESRCGPCLVSSAQTGVAFGTEDRFEDMPDTEGKGTGVGETPTVAETGEDWIPDSSGSSEATISGRTEIEHLRLPGDKVVE